MIAIGQGRSILHPYYWQFCKKELGQKTNIYVSPGVNQGPLITRLVDFAACTHCGHEKETLSHFIEQCPWYTRLRVFNTYLSSINDIMDAHYLNKIISYAHKTRRLLLAEDMDNSGVTYRFSLISGYHYVSGFTEVDLFLLWPFSPFSHVFIFHIAPFHTPPPFIARTPSPTGRLCLPGGGQNQLRWPSPCDSLIRIFLSVD